MMPPSTSGEEARCRKRWWQGGQGWKGHTQQVKQAPPRWEWVDGGGGGLYGVGGGMVMWNQLAAGGLHTVRTVPRHQPSQHISTAALSCRRAVQEEAFFYQPPAFSVVPEHTLGVWNCTRGGMSAQARILVYMRTFTQNARHTKMGACMLGWHPVQACDGFGVECQTEPVWRHASGDGGLTASGPRPRNCSYICSGHTYGTSHVCSPLHFKIQIHLSLRQPRALTTATRMQVQCACTCP